MRRRIYIDTSVIGGCLDPGLSASSEALMRLFRPGEDVAVISDLTEVEVYRSPEGVRQVLDRIPAEAREDVQLGEEAAALADHYIRAGVVSKAHLLDAQHIAIATLERVDVLASWNYRHIVNLSRIRGYNSVNLRQGRPMLEIRSPQELIPYDNETI